MAETVYFVTTTLIPLDPKVKKAKVKVEKVTARKIKNLVRKAKVKHSIRHPATIELINQDIGKEVLKDSNFINEISIKPGQTVTLVAIKLRGRLPKGAEIGVEQLKKIGYDYYLMQVKAQ